MKRRRSACFFRHEQLDWFRDLCHPERSEGSALQSLEGAMRAWCRRLGDEPRVGACPLDHWRGILRGGRRRLADRRGDGDEQSDQRSFHDRQDMLASAKRLGCWAYEYVG